MSTAPSFSNRLLVLLAVLGSPACNSYEAPNTPSQANPLDAEESAAIAQVNQIRANAGITAPLIVCTSLNVSASKHADDMRDKGYLSDTAPDGSDVRARACEAGYQTGCDANSSMAELVASGVDSGEGTVTQWVNNMKSNTILVNPALVAVGIGVSIDINESKWAMDLGGADEPSCHTQ